MTTTANKFDKLDANHDGILAPAEFAAGAPKPKAAKPRCACPSDNRRDAPDDEDN